VSKLVLRFDNTTLREVPLGTSPVTIGRAPDNDICIDNLAVSNYHARVFSDSGRLQVEDLKSLNGTFLNGTKVVKEWLNSGDVILIGKHSVVLDEAHDATVLDAKAKVSAPKLSETVVFSKKEGFTRSPADAVSAEADRIKVPRLIVVKGKANGVEYSLASKLVVIGKSPMATVRLRGWFAPKVAAQISKRQDGYHLTGMNKRPPKINGSTVAGDTRLNDGDLIEVSGVRLKFTYQD
jgi:hypothetical protein